MPHIELAPSIRRAATAGILCDSKWGTNIFVDYGVLDELFAHPTRLKRSLPREVLVGYLRSESVSPQPFEHLARRYPQGANEVFAALLHKPEFDWERDGQAVLEAMKPRYYEREPLPDVTVLSERISAGLRERS